MLLIIIWYFFHNYFWPRPWPQPSEIGFGLGLVALSLASASRFWTRLTSLVDVRSQYHATFSRYTNCELPHQIFTMRWTPVSRRNKTGLSVRSAVCPSCYSLKSEKKSVDRVFPLNFFSDFKEFVLIFLWLAFNQS